MRFLKIVRPFIFAVPILLVSCASVADYDFTKINSNLSIGNYAAVEEEIESNAKKMYSSHDDVLSELDMGLLEHYSGNFPESNEHLSEAEKLIDKYSSRSISQTVTSALTNDLAQDYSGEPFEDIYTNLFMSLNYVALDELDDALVEVRRFDNKVKVLKSKFEYEIQKAENEKASVEKVSTEFSDSALARWLSMLLYRTDGDKSNAAVDLKMLRSAFQSQKTLYNFSPPSNLDDELSVPKNMARLNVLAFFGRAPIKIEEITRVPSTVAGSWFKLALPTLKKINSEITSVKVTAKNDSTQETYSLNAEKIESLENISADTFLQRRAVIKAKAIARAIARTATTTTMDVLAAKTDNEGLAALFSVAGLFSRAYTEAVERADVRTSRYFPATASVCGITVNEGLYNVTVDFYSGNRIVFSETQQIDVQKNALNLIESTCLR